MSREIPGFYYDASRERYFRIQPNHRVILNSESRPSSVGREEDDDGHAGGSAGADRGGGYSRQAVKRKREEELMEDESERWQARMERETIRRSRLDENWKTGASLVRMRLNEKMMMEGGVSDIVARYWAAAATRQPVCSIDEEAKVKHGPGPGFCVNKSTGTIFMTRIYVSMPPLLLGSWTEIDIKGYRGRLRFKSFPRLWLERGSIQMALCGQGGDNEVGTVLALPDAGDGSHTLQLHVPVGSGISSRQSSPFLHSHPLRKETLYLSFDQPFQWER